MNDKSREKVAVITGGGSGIGLALAQTFSATGYAVVIAGRDQERLRRAVAGLRNGSKTIAAIQCDVRDPVSVDNLFASIRRQHSTIDVLINNAGVSHAPAPIAKLNPEVWKQVIESNLTGTFLVTRAALPMMRSGSTIVNNLSIAAVEVFKGMSAYNASKAGALAFTRVLREELREQGIRVLSLLPGATNTEIWRQFWPEAPREKMVSPETIAQAVLHAVSVPAGTSIEEIRMGPATGVL